MNCGHVHVWDDCSIPVFDSCVCLFLCPLLPIVPTEWPHTFARLFLLKSSLEDSIDNPATNNAEPRCPCLCFRSFLRESYGWFHTTNLLDPCRDVLLQLSRPPRSAHGSLSRHHGKCPCWAPAAPHSQSAAAARLCHLVSWVTSLSGHSIPKNWPQSSGVETHNPQMGKLIFFCGDCTLRNVI